jgi:hypothetical protein
MHYSDHMNGWDWLWMAPMMLLWILVLGVVVYIAVKLASKPPRREA